MASDNEIPKSQTAEQVIATRRLRSKNKGDVTVSIFLPTLRASGEWRCGFLISGLGKEVRDHADGVDGIESIIVALQGLRAYLDGLDEPLTWLDGEAGAFGIPLWIPDSFGREIERHLRKLVLDETTKLIAARRSATKTRRPSG